MGTRGISITKVDGPQDLAETITLFKAYVESLDIDLTFQDFATEMASMPGKYAAPTGSLLLARNQERKAVGCVGLRPLSGDGLCEVKRLYVSSQGRGRGVGRALAEHVLQEAKRLGYKSVRLDTLPNMESARALYKSLGFREVEAYYDTPLEGTIFLESRLDG